MSLGRTVCCSAAICGPRYDYGNDYHHHYQHDDQEAIFDMVLPSSSTTKRPQCSTIRTPHVSGISEALLRDLGA